MLKSDVFIETVAGVTTQVDACCGAMGSLLARNGVRLVAGFKVMAAESTGLLVWVHYCPACGQRQ